MNFKMRIESNDEIKKDESLDMYAVYQFLLITLPTMLKAGKTFRLVAVSDESDCVVTIEGVKQS